MLALQRSAGNAATTALLSRKLGYVGYMSLGDSWVNMVNAWVDDKAKEQWARIQALEEEVHEALEEATGPAATTVKAELAKLEAEKIPRSRGAETIATLEGFLKALEPVQADDDHGAQEEQEQEHEQEDKGQEKSEPKKARKKRKKKKAKKAEDSEHQDTHEATPTAQAPTVTPTTPVTPATPAARVPMARVPVAHMWWRTLPDTSNDAVKSIAQGDGIGRGQHSADHRPDIVAAFQTALQGTYFRVEGNELVLIADPRISFEDTDTNFGRLTLTQNADALARIYAYAVRYGNKVGPRHYLKDFPLPGGGTFRLAKALCVIINTNVNPLAKDLGTAYIKD